MTSENERQSLTEMEIDIIGEVMNISMGSAATAMSTIMGKKVGITTPRIECTTVEDFEFSYLEPVVGVLIKYVEGIEGTNILLLREDDLKRILGHLLSMDPSEITEMDEISTSAICEIMNQMMGSAASALATFLGHVVNNSPPEVLEETENVVDMFAIKGDSLVSIKFNLNIEGLVESEFISAMDPVLARDIAKRSLGVSNMDEENDMGQVQEDQPTAQTQQETQVQQEVQQVPLQPQNEVQYVSPPPPAYQPYAYESHQHMAPPIQAVPKEPIQATPYEFRPLGAAAADLGIDENNLELIMSVPIQISVELGRTKKKIKDIADLTIGNIVELNRQAGDQVDVIANGRLIARGDVVVVDDNYSVRITEIVKVNPESKR